MTRFLARSLADLENTLNDDTERLFAYHHATKHSYDSVRSSAHFLDWDNQPEPFRRYEGAPMVKLSRKPRFPNVGTLRTIAALHPAQRASSEAVQFDLELLSRLLWHSLAVSAWKQVPKTQVRYSLRVNPSSGNLHPTEAHLALCGFAGIEDGLYHYRADTHVLEQRGRGAWVRELADALALPGAQDVPLIVALTSIFWREAWKYRDRAYRYCCHDLGHASMSLLLAGHALGLRGSVVAHFSDRNLARVLGLAQSDEAPLAFVIFERTNKAISKGPASARPVDLLSVEPNELSAEEVPYYLLLGMHRSTVLPEPAPSLPQIREERGTPPEPMPAPEPRRDATLSEVVRRRRSALDFDPKTPPMERAVFEQLLDFATRDWPADWRGNFDASEDLVTHPGRDFIELFAYAHRIRDLEPGVYFWSPRERRREHLHTADVQRVAAYLSLEQRLAGNACFALSMVADLAAAAKIYGNRGYRYVHFEAGAIGQRLYLGAEALGWNATGIGAFYDDDVHRYFGFVKESAPIAESVYAAEQEALVALTSEVSFPAISESHEEQRRQSTSAAKREEESGAARFLPKQVIYHFAVGRAVCDPRLSAPEEQ